MLVVGGVRGVIHLVDDVFDVRCDGSLFKTSSFPLLNHP